MVQRRDVLIVSGLNGFTGSIDVKLIQSFMDVLQSSEISACLRQICWCCCVLGSFS